MYRYQDDKYEFARYPATENRSLRAWSAADEHILQHFESLSLEQESPAIFNDRFGFLTSHLSTVSPSTTINYASQKKAILKNLETNQVSIENLKFVEPFEVSSKKILGLTDKRLEISNFK